MVTDMDQWLFVIVFVFRLKASDLEDDNHVLLRIIGSGKAKFDGASIYLAEHHLPRIKNEPLFIILSRWSHLWSEASVGELIVDYADAFHGSALREPWVALFQLGLN